MAVRPQIQRTAFERVRQTARAGELPRHTRWRVPRAKIAVPRVPVSFVRRERLRRLLDQAAEVPVTVICAPAGYGKTLMLADWVTATPVAWVSLDRDDNDASRFWSAVLSAMAECVPSDSPLRDLAPPAVADEPGFLAEVVDALDALDTPLRLVLDDVHEIVALRTLRGVEALIRYVPKGLRLVLSTRLDPPLPLARLRSQGNLAEIRANRLRFCPDDAAAMLRAAGVELDDEQLRLLVDQTEGWAAGLRLAALSLRDAADRDEFLADFAADDRSVADYLVGEVLTRLPGRTREFLRVISVCDEVSPPLAAALSGLDDAGVLLDVLERESSLVTSVDIGGQRYRIHTLLRSYLRADLDRQQPERTAELHGTAAKWFASEQRVLEALDHAGQAGDQDMVVALLHRHAVMLLLTGEHHDVTRALALVGPGTVTQDPSLALISAFAHLATGELAAAETDFACSNAIWPSTCSTDMALLRWLVGAHLALVRGKPSAALLTAEYPGGLLSMGAGLEAWARMAVGWTSLYAADLATARRELREALRLARGNGFDHLVVQCQTVLGAACALSGDYPAMAEASAAAIGLASERGWCRAPWLATDYLVLAFARLLRLDPAGSRHYAAQAERANRAAHEPRLRFMISFVEGAARFDAGDRLTGLHRMRQARRQLGDVVLLPELAATVAVLEHRCTVKLGQHAHAREVFDWTRARIGDTAELSLLEAWSLAMTAQAGVSRALRGALDVARPRLSPITRVEARLLETTIELRQGQRTKARCALEAALALAEPAGLILPFGEAGSSVRQLLVDQQGGFGVLDDFASRVCEAVTRFHAGRTHGALTQREQAVLARLPSQWPLDEIASDLTLSVNTVKTHVRSVYTKLGVSNRRAAVVAARELGLI
ncbi:LuxR family maltose regulon positive regulatory protein [Kibdelosporangium banguiense]|uniref:LuxR family maltose regulon positive regulatory protein n=1 Tax=Kibdelosporangium banguiense TaxID=1365924 RepID=A0ABS4TI08_9PSEU|nr:LuxR C-terminal-related transcriptional regulator [Kibdelosporangium banguiense]MBP2323498.1 LuxR family maltose regulon positive regulatory protein [Kibdelosporangium banguiense]